MLTSIEVTVLNIIMVFANWELFVSVPELKWPLTILRFATCFIYIAHSFYMFKKYGPTYENLEGLAEHLQNGSVQPAPSLFFALFALFGGNIFYSFHWNYCAPNCPGNLSFS